MNITEESDVPTLDALMRGALEPGAPAPGATVPGAPAPGATVPGAPASGAPLVPQFYAGRSVLITGATGFMGKVVVARLLATCPGVRRVLLLMRRTRDEAPAHRLSLLCASEVFCEVRARNPHLLERLAAVEGDITQDRCGVSKEGLQQLQEVSVVLHCAAQVKFNKPLREAAQNNVSSAAALLALADCLPRLQVVVHVSTAFCNAEFQHIEERVYAPRLSADQLAAALRLPDDVLRAAEHALVAPKTNTYVLTKALAECVVQNHRPRHYAVAIFRPTIVVCAERHPAAGWIDSPAGPAAVALAFGRGLLHAYRVRDAARADLVPVDLCADTLICAAWDTATARPQEARVYNCSSMENPTTWRQFRDALLKYARKYPFDSAAWYPFIFTTESACTYKLLEAVLQRAPLFVLAVGYWILGVHAKPPPREVAARLRRLDAAQEYFSRREWIFEVGNTRALRARLSRADRALFHLDAAAICWDELYRSFVLGVRRHLLREADAGLPRAARRLRRLRALHYAAVAALCVCVAAPLLL